MAGRARGYEIEIGDVAAGQLRWLRRQDRAAANRVEDAIAERLTFEPTREDRNRKSMVGTDAVADFELRVQPFRVYYDVDETSGSVTVVSIYRKPRETATSLRTE